MPDKFSVTDSDIYLGHYHVGTLKPDLWATLHDDAVELLEVADFEAVDEQTHRERIDELEKEASELADERDTLKERCEAYEDADGTKDELHTLRTELEAARGLVDYWHEQAMRFKRDLVALKAPKPRKRRAA